jgi:ketosteroid isomerase-like protein
MSEENIEFIRKAVEAWQRGGIEAMLEYASPDIEWNVRADMPDHVGTHQGHDGVRELHGAMTEAFEDMAYEPQEYIDAGDRVALVLHRLVRGKGSGIEIAERRGETWVFTIRDGKVAAVQEYPTKGQALQALELSE